MCDFFPFFFRTRLLCYVMLIMFLKLSNHCACLFSIYLPTPTHTVCLTTDNTTPTGKERDCTWEPSLEAKNFLLFCGFRECTSKMIRQVSSSTTLEAAWKIPLVSLSQKLLSKKVSALISSPPKSSSGCCSHRVCSWAEVGVGNSVS